MQAPPSSHMVTICGETYDIYSRRFEQLGDNLPAIGSFYKNFEKAVLSLTKSNIFMLHPQNYVHGTAQDEILLCHRINGTPYPYDLGRDQHGYPFQNPPPLAPDDRKTYSYLQKSIASQQHEDNKALQMLWSWLGDYRRHSFTDVYQDPLIPTRDKINTIVRRHKACLVGVTRVIIARYKAQWNKQKMEICTNLQDALRNLHLLFSINTSIADLDPRYVYTTTELLIELIPTLQHNSFSPLVDTWNEKINADVDIPIPTIQAAMEKCFLVKSSLNDLDCYSFLALQPVDTNPRRSSSSSSSSSPSASTSPSKQGYAYAATSQDPPTTTAQIQKMIEDAIANDRQRRQRSSSPSNQSNNRDHPRERSRDRDSDRSDRDRRPANKYKSHRESTRDPRREQSRGDASMPRSPNSGRGDRSPSSDRKESSSPASGKSRA